MAENTVSSVDSAALNRKNRYGSYSREMLALSRKHASKEKLHGRKAKKPCARRV